MVQKLLLCRTASVSLGPLLARYSGSSSRTWLLQNRGMVSGSDDGLSKGVV